jgi:hypothetical protein
MNTLTRFDDRRKKRSANTHRAIELQLEHVVEQYKFYSMVVSNRDGLYVASAGEAIDRDCVAAYSPYIGEALGEDREGFKHDLLDEIEVGEAPKHVAVRSFPAEGAKLYVCVVSPRRDGLDVALDHTVQGIRRIFRATRAA